MLSVTCVKVTFLCFTLCSRPNMFSGYHFQLSSMVYIYIYLKLYYLELSEIYRNTGMRLSKLIFYFHCDQAKSQFHHLSSRSRQNGNGMHDTYKHFSQDDFLPLFATRIEPDIIRAKTLKMSPPYRRN